MINDGKYYNDANGLNGNCICSDADCKSPIKWIHVINASVRESARMIHHPVESGGRIFDNKVIEPLTINVSCRIMYSEADNLQTEFHDMLVNRKYAFYSVMTKEGEYPNLELTSCSHKEMPDKFDVFDFELVFTQVMFGGENENEPSNQDDSSTK